MILTESPTCGELKTDLSNRKRYNQQILPFLGIAQLEANVYRRGLYLLTCYSWQSMILESNSS